MKKVILSLVVLTILLTASSSAFAHFGGTDILDGQTNSLAGFHKYGW